MFVKSTNKDPRNATGSYAFAPHFARTLINLDNYPTEPISDHSPITVDLPFGDRMFPDGPGSDLVNSNCLACHSAGMVLNQPALSKAQWRTEVEKMRTAYKAPIDPKDVDAIVNYLIAVPRAK